jgi:hypothetical protein
MSLLLTTLLFAGDFDGLCGTAQHQILVGQLGNGDPKRGELVFAKHELEEAQTARQRATALFLIGEAYDGLSEHRLARTFFRRAIAIWRKQPPSEVESLTQYLWYLGRYVERLHNQDRLADAKALAAVESELRALSRR